eukprot:gene6360-2989_t
MFPQIQPLARGRVRLTPYRSPLARVQVGLDPSRAPLTRVQVGLAPSSAPQARAQVEKGLRIFVSQLPPPPIIQESARSVIHEVVQTLQQAAATSSRFRVSRTCVAGSFGKGTTVHPIWDVDLVFFIRIREGNSSPPYPDVLGALADALEQRFPDDVQIYETTTIALKINFKDFDLDILAAPDLTEVDLPASGPAWTQQRALLEKMESLSDEPAKLAIAFFKSPFVRDAVRLCKLWSRGLIFGKRPPNLSYVVELVAVHSAQYLEAEAEGERDGRPKLIDAFLHFLRALHEYRSLNIAWVEHYEESDVDPETEEAELNERTDQAELTGIGPLFEVQFSQSSIGSLGQAFGRFKQKIDDSWLLGTRSDPEIVMAHGGMPYVEGNLDGKYDIDEITDLLISVLAVQGLGSMATGRDAMQGTEDVIDKLRATLFVGSTPARWTAASDPDRQIRVVVPLTPTLAVVVSFDLE